MLLPVSQLLIKASISLVFVWESFFALSEWIRGISSGGYLLSSSVRRPSQPMISWSGSLHRVLLPEEAPHHVGALDHPEHHHHVNARHLLPMCDVTAARAAPVLQVDRVDEAGFRVHHSDEGVITHILIRLQTIPIALSCEERQSSSFIICRKTFQRHSRSLGQR